jgi:hypothetical protein
MLSLANTASNNNTVNWAQALFSNSTGGENTASEFNALCSDSTPRTATSRLRSRSARFHITSKSHTAIVGFSAGNLNNAIGMGSPSDPK